MKAWVHQSDSVEGEDVTQYMARKQDASNELPEYSTVASTSVPPGPPSAGTNLGRLRRTPQGISKLVGVREGAWFKKWEGTIRRAVIARRQYQEPMYQPDAVQRENAGALLDGFYG